MAIQTTIEVLRIPGTLFPRGAFDENASYKFLNIVESGGSGYVCLQPCTGIPVTNTAYWFKFVFKGDKGDAFTYADLTAEQKAELVRDATAAAQAAASSAQSAADDAAAALQKFNTIKAAIDAIDPQSTEGSIQTLAAKQGLLEADLNALGPEIDQLKTEAQISTFEKSTFTSQTANITPASVITMSQAGDYIEIKVKANDTGSILHCPEAYNAPTIRYSSANTLQIRFNLSTGVFTYQNAAVDNTKVQVIKIVLDSVGTNEYNYSIYLDGAKVGTATSAARSNPPSPYWEVIGRNTTMDLYYIKGKQGGVDYEFSEFSKMTGAVGVTDVYDEHTYDGIVPLNNRTDALEGKTANLESSVWGEDMYYSYSHTSELWWCLHHFAIYQRIKENIYLKTFIVYYKPTDSSVPNGYWRMERTNVVRIADGEVTTIESQVLTPGENEFVLQWLEDGYNFSGGYTGGYHEGETIENVDGAWVEFVIDGNRVQPTQDIILCPCKSFLYREYAPIYQNNDDTIAAWHLKETVMKDGGYETTNEVKFVQAIDYFAYTGIVCVGRNISEYAMPEGAVTITDMGDGSTTISEQFKSNGHSIHYEGGGYSCDVESKVLFGADDSQCSRVVYNASAYNKFYRRNPDTQGSTSNRMKGWTKVVIRAL